MNMCVCVCNVSLHVAASYCVLRLRGNHPYYSIPQFPHACGLSLTGVLFLCSVCQACRAEFW